MPVPYADLHNPQSLNLYSYVQDRPTSARDQDGHYLSPQDPPPELDPLARELEEREAQELCEFSARMRD